MVMGKTYQKYEHYGDFTAYGVIPLSNHLYGNNTTVTFCTGVGDAERPFHKFYNFITRI